MKIKISHIINKYFIKCSKSVIFITLVATVLTICDIASKQLQEAESFQKGISEVVFVDNSIKNYKELITGIVNDISPHESINQLFKKNFIVNNTQIITLDSSVNEVQQITQVLSQHADLAGIHLFSHGSNNQLVLGNDTLNNENINQYKNQIQAWGNALNSEGDFLIYGCEVAQQKSGIDFIQRFSELTHADVLASTNKTGSKKLKGDWALEYKIGTIQTASIKANNFTGILKNGVPDIITHKEPATPYSYTKNGFTYQWGQGSNIIIDGFTFDGNTYDYKQLANSITLVRENNPVTTGVRNTLFVEMTAAGDNRILQPDYPLLGDGTGNIDLAEVIGSNIINRGVLDLFANVDNVGTAKNIERVDIKYTGGITAPATNVGLSQAGFIVTEKRGNNNVVIAAITAVNGSGIPTAYGPPVMVFPVSQASANKYAYSPTNIRTDNAFLGNEINAPQTQLEPIYYCCEETLGVVFVDLEALGVNTGQVFYGFSLFGGDTAKPVADAHGRTTWESGIDPIDTATFPLDTSRALNTGDADVYGGIGGYFTANPSTPKKCFAMSDDVAELYSFDFDLSTPPTVVNTTRLFNGEGTAYRSTDNALYVFDQAVKLHNEPSDLYKVELDGSSTLIASNFIASRAAGAEFVRYSDGSEHFMVLMDEFDAHIQTFDASNLASTPPLKTLYLTFPDGSKAQVTSLAINPKTGEVLVVDDADAVDDYPEVYSVNMNTGRLTLKVTLSVPGIDAESLAFAEDGFIYIENEGVWTSAPYSHHIYRVNLTTGDITAVEDNLDSVISGDIEGMSCTGSKITTPPPPPPIPYDPKPCGVPGFLETFGSGAGRSPIPASSWSNYDYDEGPADTNNGAIVMDDQYTVLDKSSIASAGHWWIVDDDHTGDANGRMLMVNAHYFAGEFYRQSITGLEVGKEYSFAAHIANAEGDAEVRIPVNVKFSIESNGAEIGFVETGDILQDPGRDELAWAQYELKFTATSSDIDIVLVNNIGGGIGNDLVIDDISISEVCNVCSALTGEVSEADLPITTHLKTGDKIIVPSKSISSNAGHVRAYSIDSSGVPSTTKDWDAALMNKANRETGLYSTDASGNNIVLFNSGSLDNAAFGSPSLPIATIKANTISPPSGAFLGGISKGNSLEIMTNSMNTSLYLYDTTYRTYYENTITTRDKQVLVSSDDGFLYAFNYDTGTLLWGWTPRSLVKELEDYATIQQKHLMAGTIEILDLKDGSNHYATYVIGSYKSGLGHYVLKLNDNGTLNSVVWDDDKSSSFVKSPNNGEMEFFRDGSSVIHATYVLSNSTNTSSVIIKSLVDNTVDLSVNLNYQATSTPFVMQDYGKNNAPKKKTVYIGTKTGDLHAASLLTAGGDIEVVAAIKAELEDASVAQMDDNPTDEVIHINASIAAKDNRYYLSAQTPKRLTLFKYDSTGSSWMKAWTSYVSGAGRWNSGTYTADNSGVPTDQGGFLIVPSTVANAIQSLPSDATVTDKAVIVADTVVLPISVLPETAAACYGKAYYYLYSLTDGSFPKKSFYKTDNTEIETNIALGYGEASQLTISDLLGKDKLLGYGSSDQNKDLNIELGSPFVIKDPVATGIRGWKEIGR